MSRRSRRASSGRREGRAAHPKRAERKDLAQRHDDRGGRAVARSFAGDDERAGPAHAAAGSRSRLPRSCQAVRATRNAPKPGRSRARRGRRDRARQSRSAVPRQDDLLVHASSLRLRLAPREQPRLALAARLDGCGGQPPRLEPRGVLGESRRPAMPAQHRLHERARHPRASCRATGVRMPARSRDAWSVWRRAIATRTADGRRARPTACPAARLCAPAPRRAAATAGRRGDSLRSPSRRANAGRGRARATRALGRCEPVCRLLDRPPGRVSVAVASAQRRSSSARRCATSSSR